MPRIISSYAMTVSVELPPPPHRIVKMLHEHLDDSFKVTVSPSAASVTIAYSSDDPTKLPVARERAVNAINRAYRGHYSPD